jgi:hypothetical protein
VGDLCASEEACPCFFSCTFRFRFLSFGIHFPLTGHNFIQHISNTTHVENPHNGEHSIAETRIGETDKMILVEDICGALFI